MLSLLRDGSVFLWVSLCRIQCEKQNREWHNGEVDDETGYRDRNGAEASEQIAENGWAYKWHCWRGGRQRCQRAGAQFYAEHETGEQKHRTVEANDRDAQGDDQWDVLTESYP